MKQNFNKLKSGMKEVGESTFKIVSAGSVIAGQEAKKFAETKGPVIKENMEPRLQNMVRDYDKVGMWCNMGGHFNDGTTTVSSDLPLRERYPVLDKMVKDHDKVGMWCNNGAAFKDARENYVSSDSDFGQKMVKNYDKVGMWCNMGGHFDTSKGPNLQKMVENHDKVGMWCNNGGAFKEAREFKK